MNDSKIGTWLTKDGRTAIVLADAGTKATYSLIGFVLSEKGSWEVTSWTNRGTIMIHQQYRADLERKVSDSTELKPWKPEKRWRPWTVEEVKAKVLAGLWARRNGDAFVIQFTGFGTEHVLAADGNFIKFESLFNYWTQHDGTPCGVEVEE